MTLDLKTMVSFNEKVRLRAGYSGQTMGDKT